MVRDQRLADSVDASYGMSGRGPQLFSISASPAKGKSLAVIEENIRKILADIKVKGVSRTELDRVKSQLVSAQIYKRDSIFAQAMEIGMAEMNSISWKYLDDMLLNVQKVQSEDIQRVVGKYLIDDSLTVATLDPQVSQKKPSGPQTLPSGMRH
jgi:zinc protease